MTMEITKREKLIDLTLNGEKVKIFVKSNETLLDIIRKNFQIKSVKAACWSGDCGICLVLVDDIPIKSCLVLAQEMNNKHITTVEGLSKNHRLTKLQDAFIKYGAVQCGFCTGAFLLLGQYLLNKGNSLTRDELVKSLNGIICRCTGYKQIIDAFLSVYDHP